MRTGSSVAPAENMLQTWSLEALSESCVIAFIFLGTVFWKCITDKSPDFSVRVPSSFSVRSSGLSPGSDRDPLKIRDVRVHWLLQFLPWPRNSTDTKWVLANVLQTFLK